MKNFAKIVVLVLAVSVILPFAAQAKSLQFVNYDNTGYEFNRIVDGRETSANTGVFNAVIYDDAGQPMNNGEWFSGFCVEPGSPIRTGDWLSSSVSAGAFNNGAGLKAAWLLDTYFYGQTTSGFEQAALQLALWEVVKDDEYDLSSGSFQVIGGNTAVQETTELYLADLENNYDTADTERLSTEYTVFVDDIKQDLIFKTGSAVPEPSTLLLLGSGMLGIVAIQRKRSKK